MATQEAVSLITIRGQSVGLDKLATDVRAVDQAQQGVVASSENVEKRTLSVERSLQRLQRQYDQTYRAQQELARATRTLDQAQAQGLVTEERRAEILALATDRLTKNLSANDNLTRSHTGLSAEAQAAGHSIRSFVDSVAAGQSPTTALAQQIGNLQFAASGRGGLSGALAEVSSTLRGLVTPARLAGAALAAAAVTATIAWNRYDDAQKEAIRTLQGMGRGLGVTSAGFEEMAQRIASAGQISVAAARDIANSLGRTGQGISTQSIERLASVSKDFAATYTKGDLQAGFEKINELVSSGASGISTWGREQNLFNSNQLKTINDAVRHRDINLAINTLLDGLNGKMASWKDTTGTLAKSWDEIKKALSDIMTAFGPFVDKMASVTGGFLQAAARGAQNIASGDFSQNPISRAAQGRDLSGFATAAGGAEPSAITEKYQQLAAKADDAAKATENLANAQSKVQPQLAQTGSEVVKLDDDLRSAQKQLRDQLNESFNAGDRTAIEEKLVKVREALEGTSQAAKKSAVSFAQSDNAQIAAADAADKQAAATNRANVEANRLSTIAQDNAQKIVSESEAYKDAKATLDLFADARRQQVTLTDEQIEAEERARHIVESQTDAEGRRLTQADQAEKIRATEIASIKARTLAQEQAAGSDEVENRNRGRSITGLQAEAEQRHAATVILTRWQEQQERTNRGIRDNIAVTELQRNGIFANDQERAAAIARMQAELEMVERLGPGWRSYAEAVKYVDLRAAAARSSAELQKQQQLWTSLESTASNALSSLAKDLTSGVKPAEALTKAIGGIGDSLSRIGTESLAKSLTNGLKGVLGGGGTGGFSFDPVSLGIGAAGLGLSLVSSLFSGNAAKRQQQRQQNIDAWQKAQEDDLAAIQKQQQAVIDAGIAAANAAEQAAENATRKAEDVRRRIESFQDRATLAGLDTTTLPGQLAALDLQQQREREQEVRDGGEALVALEAAQFAEREKLLRDYTTQAIAEEKRRFDEAKAFLDQFSRTIQAFISGLQTSAQSPLSPAARLAAAQSQFNAQLGLAQGGNRDALNAITTNASTLIDAAKAFYASSQGFQDIYNTVIAQLGALPGQVTPEQLIVNAIDSQTQSLGDILNQLDANGDGMISRQEAANTWLASLFNEIDVNGDGQITKLELIRFATAGTQTSVDSTNASVTASNALLATEQSILNTMSGIMSAVSANTNATVSGIQNDIAQAQTLGTYTQKIVFNTASIAQHDGAPAQFSRGGWVNGPGSTTSDSIRAMLSNGEFVVRAQAASVYGPMLEAMNAGRALPVVPVDNDNSGLFGALIGEVRMLTARVAQLEASLVRATVAGAEHVREGVDNVAASHGDLVRETKKRAA